MDKISEKCSFWILASARTAMGYAGRCRRGAVRKVESLAMEFIFCLRLPVFYAGTSRFSARQTNDAERSIQRMQLYGALCVICLSSAEARRSGIKHWKAEAENEFHCQAFNLAYCATSAPSSIPHGGPRRRKFQARTFF